MQGPSFAVSPARHDVHNMLFGFER
jgi:hypothetical protein